MLVWGFGARAESEFVEGNRSTVDGVIVVIAERRARIATSDKSSGLFLLTLYRIFIIRFVGIFLYIEIFMILVAIYFLHQLSHHVCQIYCMDALSHCRLTWNTTRLTTTASHPLLGQRWPHILRRCHLASGSQ